MGYAPTAENLASPVPDYLDVFRLSHDPFEPSPDEELVFFAGGQREAILDQVAHLSQFSSSVVVVTGAAGSGRTILKDMLLLQLQDQYLIADLDVAMASSPQQVFADMAVALGHEVAAEAGAGELIAAIRSGLQHLQAAETDTLLLLLDNAHLLSDAYLGALLSLLQAAEPEESLPFQLVLFGDPDLIDRLDGIGMVDILLHDIPLPPLNEEEMADYLAFRLETAGWDGELPFTDAEVEDLCRAARGLPGAVHQPARELLITRAQEPGVGLPPPPSSGLPVAHIFSLVVLVCVLLMAFFYRDSWLGSDDEVDAVGVSVVLPGQRPANGIGSERQGTAIRLPIGEDNPPPAAPARAAPPAPAYALQDAPASAAASRPTSSASSWQESAADSRSAPSHEARQDSAASAAEVRQELAEGAPAGRSADTPQQLSGAIQRSVAAPTAVPVVAQTRFTAAADDDDSSATVLPVVTPAPAATRAPAVAPAPTSAPALAVAAAPAPAPASTVASAPAVAPAPAPIPAPAVAPIPAPAPAASTAESVSAEERHLLSLPGGNYVLQVMASGSKAAVDGYLQSQKNRSSLYLYTAKRDGKPWYVVVTGNYSSPEMARAGAQSLPDEQKKAGPWPRRISDVHLQIKEFHSI